MRAVEGSLKVRNKSQFFLWVQGAVHAVAYSLIVKLPKPLSAPGFRIPSNTSIDARLVLGAALFGVGWGLSGICPGPAVVNFGVGVGNIAVFSLAAIVGVLASRAFEPKSAST